VTGASAKGTTTGVFDLEAAAEAAAGEAGAEPFEFTYKGATYDIPPGREWPVAALAALAAGELEAALSTLLGEANYLRLTEAGLTIGQLNALFTAVGAKAGFPSLPNSPLPVPRSSTQT
jgi:hypothetical protein